MNIYLLRHGETDWNLAGRLQGRTDIPLNDNGRAQMEHVGDVLRHLDSGVDLILSSPLSRAQESARIVAKKLGYPMENIVVEDMLVERCFGAGEGTTAQERKEKFMDDFSFPGMETFEEIVERARSVFGKIVGDYHERENILVVAHGAILYAVMAAIGDGRFAYVGDAIIRDQGNVYLMKYMSDLLEVERYNKEKDGFEKMDIYEGCAVLI